MSTKTDQTWTAYGWLPENPALRETKAGNAVCNFKLKCRREFSSKGNIRVEYDVFTITCWDQDAKRYAEMLEAGSVILLKGYIKNRVWTDSHGVTHFGMEVVPRSIQLMNEPAPEAVRPRI